MTPQELAQMIWNIKEIIRDDYNDKNVDEVILPFTLLRRLDCVMDVNKDIVKQVIDTLPNNIKKYEKEDIEKYHTMLSNILKPKGVSFYNISGFSWQIYSPTLKLWEITSKHTLKDLAKM